MLCDLYNALTKIYNLSGSSCLSHVYRSFLLTLPAFAAVNAGHKGGHGFIGRPSLQLIIRAFRGTALGVRAREIVGGRFHLGLVFVLVAQLLCLNQCNPLIRMHVLVRHERQFVRLDLFGCQ